MDVCAKSNAIYGISVSVRCTNDKTALPLLDDAIVERYIIMKLQTGFVLLDHKNINSLFSLCANMQVICCA